ncbi:MAG TPA: GTPase [Gemmataceae bacterium]|nr:GTPase [Gemmataceae bacterium]
MTATRVAVLTPPGSAAIAVLSIRGPRAWPVLQSHFRTARSDALPESAPAPGIFFGRFGRYAADEVILTVRNAESIELHCHGGRQVVAWLLSVLRSEGIEEIAWPDLPNSDYADSTAAALLPFARTVRTAAILLDQANGAYDRAVQSIARRSADADAIAATLHRNARVGRHLIEPWTVAIAGAPNVGKSTLMNALAGFARSIVSPIAGTTRDAVSVTLAFDGWPVDVIDTAGLRESADVLEEEGIARARNSVETSDLCLWLVDAAGPRPGSVEEVARKLGRDPERVIVAFNKCDLVDVSADESPLAIRLSAATGQGLAELAQRIAAALVPDPPRPGEPVSFTPEMCRPWS